MGANKRSGIVIGNALSSESNVDGASRGAVFV
jgi:hypothetical protein